MGEPEDRTTSAVSMQMVYSGRCQFSVSVLGPSWGTPGDGNLLDMRIFYLAVTTWASPLMSTNMSPFMHVAPAGLIGRVCSFEWDVISYSDTIKFLFQSLQFIINKKILFMYTMIYCCLHTL